MLSEGKPWVLGWAPKQGALLSFVKMPSYRCDLGDQRSECPGRPHWEKMGKHWAQEVALTADPASRAGLVGRSQPHT